MRAIWNIISSTASSDPQLPSFSGGGRTRMLTVVRRASARGLKLVVDPRDATIRLTLGTRAALRPALDWVEHRRDWVEAELKRLPPARPIVPEMAFDLAGDRVRLDWSARYPRAPRLVADAGGERLLQMGGPLDQLPARTLRFLRGRAHEVLDAETRALARTHDIAVRHVGVGDPRGRWGSCAASGDIRYSWRLILAPADVRRATVAHEVAHRVHMNHSRAFHDVVARLYGKDPSSARRWLRTHGTALHWFGRDD